jgi:CheY-like chemotaxis protein
MELIARDTPDALVSDIGLPGEDGYALIQRVRALPETSRLPALALTAYASAADHRRAIEAGFQRHVAKPVEPGELAAALMAMIAEARARAGTGPSAGSGAPPPMSLAAVSHG